MLSNLIKKVISYINNYKAKEILSDIEKIVKPIVNKATFNVESCPLDSEVFNNKIALVFIGKSPVIIYKEPNWKIAIGYGHGEYAFYPYFFESDDTLTFRARHSEHVPKAFTDNLISLICKNKKLLIEKAKEMVQDDIESRYYIKDNK